MRNTLAIILILFCSSPLLKAQDSGLTATQIIKKAEEKLRGKTSVYSEITITTKRPKWTRERTMKSWSKGDDLSLMLITSPAKEKGIAYLKIKNEAWNWMPSIERTIKMPPSMMLQNWMGTDFTNDDLLKESSNITDYTHTKLADTTVNSKKCWKIKLIPKANSPVVWSKVILCIDQKDFIQIRSESYDEDDILVNVMKASDIKMMGGQKMASKLEMIPMDKKGQSTILKFTKIEFNKPIEDSFFTTQNMKKVS